MKHENPEKSLIPKTILSCLAETSFHFFFASNFPVLVCFSFRFETGCGILNGLLAQDIEFSRFSHYFGYYFSRIIFYTFIFIYVVCWIYLIPPLLFYLA